MKAQLNLINAGLNAPVAESALLHKNLLKKRIQNTHFQSVNKSIIIKEWEAGDNLLTLFYQIEKTSLGELLVAGSSKGIVYVGFVENDRETVLMDLERRFPENTLQEAPVKWIRAAIDRINDPRSASPLQLHLKGTPFQLAIWQKLVLIPFGGLINYKQLGGGEPDSRAIGAAVGANPVGYLVPCHRVIKADGNFNGFFWGNEVKARLLKYEATQINN